MKKKDEPLFFTLNLRDQNKFSFTYVGENSTDVLGYSASILYKDFSLFYKMIHTDDRDAIYKDLVSSIETSGSVHSFLRIEIKGDFHYFELIFSRRVPGNNGIDWDGVLIGISEDCQSVPELSRHMDFEILVSSISTQFSGLSSEQIEDGLQDSLEKIGLFSSSDRVYIFIAPQNSLFVDNVYSWSKRGIKSNISKLKNIDFFKELPWISDLVKKKEVVYIPFSDMLPPEAEKERVLFESRGLKSLLIIPLVLKGELYGFMGLDSLTEFQYWAESDQLLLKLLGEVFINAINRQKVEIEFNNTNRLFEEVLRQSPIPTCIVDPDGNIMILNKAFSEKMNVNQKQKKKGNLNYLMMKAAWKITDSKGNPIRDKDTPLARALRGKMTTGKEVHLELDNGSFRWLIAAGAPVYAQDKKLIAGLITFLDITRLKQIDSDLQHRVLELNESEKRFRSYIESAPDGIYVLNDKGDFVSVNDSTCKITRYERDELLNMNFSQIIYCEDTDKAQTDFLRKEDVAIETNEYRIVTRDGEVRYVSVDVVKLNDKEFLGFAKDITENKKMVEQLRQMEKMDAIGQLAGGIAHDFNNQIAIMMGYSEMLVSKLEDPQLLKFAKNILASSHLSDDLTRKLLAFAHKGLYETVVVNIHKIIGEAVDILSHSMIKNIAIQLHLNAEFSFVKGDISQLQNILINLALNSRDAMDEGGILVFKTENVLLDETFCKAIPYDVTPGSFVKIIVSDNGRGIKSQDLSRIFEPFFTTKMLGKGTGMGLASVYGAVVNHNAVIAVTSTVGVGTEFSIYFPQVEKIIPPKLSHSSLHLSEGDISILLVDDDELIRDMGSDILKSLGYSVFLCSNGPDALDFYRENGDDIDLVILDMIMPVMGGKDVFRNLKEIDPKISVVLSSGFSISGEIQQLLDEGANAFIGKPFEVGHFSKVISSVLAQ